MNSVHIDCANIELPAWAPGVARYVERVLAEIGRDGWEVSILLCDDTFIRDLNCRYRGLDEPTDVLSFAQEGGDQAVHPLVPGIRGSPVPAGDIVISIDSLEHNVLEFGVSRDEELKRLLVHGILHLSGADHPDNDPSRPMLVLQERLIREIPGESLL